MKPKQEDPKEMVGGCCVCSDENGWAENPLVYCDGQGCNVAVHQACYGIVTVPTGAWFCRKCESQERAARVRCELCPSKDGALKRTDSGGWAHVVCALYIPEVRFGNVTTMEPIMLQLIPQERFNKSCYLCDEAQRGSKATIGACMQCNRTGCKNHFHVTCAQAMGLLCEEAGNYLDNVKYCGYCQYHYNKLRPNFQRRGSHVKTIPPYRPVPHDAVSSDEDKTSGSNTDSKDLKIKKRSSNKTSPVHDSGKQLTRELKVNLSEISGPSKSSSLNLNSGENSQDRNSSDFSVSLAQSSSSLAKSETKLNDKLQPNSSSNVLSVSTSSVTSVAKLCITTSSPGISVSKPTSINSITFPSSSLSLTSVSLPTSSSASVNSSEAAVISGQLSVTPQTSSVTVAVPTSISSSPTSEIQTPPISSISAVVSVSSKSKTVNSGTPSTSHSQPSLSVSVPSSSMEKDKHRKIRRNGSRPNSSAPLVDSDATATESEGQSKEGGTLTICEERNLGMDRDNKSSSKVQSSPDDSKLNVQFTPNVSAQCHKSECFHLSVPETSVSESTKRSRPSSQDRGRRSKRGSSSGGGTASKRGRMAVPPARETAKESIDSGASSPETSTPDVSKRGKNTKGETKDCRESLNSVITNGLGANTLLLGNQINPASAVAQKMTDTLHAELEAHSIYKEEEKLGMGFVGPALPGKRETSTPGAILSSGQPPPLPQSLEQLLERQWEQGSQFLMEQAQHFDIASLLSCLHQLRQENVRLEETVTNLVARRDHLLAVNARLSVPLASNPGAASTLPSSSATAPASTSVSVSLSSNLSSLSSSISSHPISVSSTSSALVSLTSAGASNSLVGTHVAAIPGPPSGAVISATRQLPQQRHPSGGSSHPSMNTPSTGLSGRGTSPHDRRAPLHQGAPPLENGLGETEYRYRSPGTDHQHRQQSPMLPPGAQPSPTLMRQSPASSSYHSSSSPHTGVLSLSPSAVVHQPPLPHTLVAHVPTHTSHGHASGMASSSHGVLQAVSHTGTHTGHTVALSRPSEPNSRAELVRLTTSQPHSNPSVGYPVYQMVSPPVPGPHHSPVGMPQHPQHSQVLRREVVESGRGSHLLEKR